MVEDVLIDDLRRKAPEPMVYFPAVSASPAYVIKSSRADQLEPEVRAIIREVIPTSPMYRIFTMERLAANAMANLSFTMLMVSIAAVLALVLGAVGLYGVLSYRVTKRAQEIGVRMALGAEAKTVRRMFVWQGGQVALIGIVVGVLAAVALTTYIQTLLFGVGRLDVLAFAGMSAVMLAVALLASYVPALTRLARGSGSGAAGGIVPAASARTTSCRRVARTVVRRSENQASPDCGIVLRANLASRSTRTRNISRFSKIPACRTSRLRSRRLFCPDIGSNV